VAVLILKWQIPNLQIVVPRKGTAMFPARAARPSPAAAHEQLHDTAWLKPRLDDGRAQGGRTGTRPKATFSSTFPGKKFLMAMTTLAAVPCRSWVLDLTMNMQATTYLQVFDQLLDYDFDSTCCKPTPHWHLAGREDVQIKRTT